VSRTFRATLEIPAQSRGAHGRVTLAAEVVEELGLQPGESLRAVMRGTEFTGKVLGSQKSPGLQVPGDVLRALSLRDGQGVRVTVLGRAG
jgi:antitoxin component of MazEF toxin-antitoxin module